MYRDPMTVDDVLVALIADPLHKLDCCAISDGGGVHPDHRGAGPDLQQPPVFVRGAAGGSALDHQPDARLHAGGGERAESVRGGRHHTRRRRHVHDVRLVHVHGAGRARRPRVRPKGEGGAFVEEGDLEGGRAADEHRRRRSISNHRGYAGYS